MTARSGRIQNGRPRVLMVTGGYYPEISSSGLQCQHVAKTLGARIDAHILTTAVDQRLPSSDVVDGVPVSRIKVDVASATSRASATVRMIRALLRFGREADVVHLHGFSRKNLLVTAMARLIGRPVVMSLHTAGFDEPESIARQGRLSWWAFASADLYLSVSPLLVDAYLAAGLPPQKIRQVPNGIDLDRFSPPAPSERLELRRRLGLPVDRPIVLFVGFFSREKQPDVLFDAWLAMQQDPALASTLVFVGATRSKYFEVDDRLAERMREEAARHGVADRLMLVGETHDVQDYYRAANLFALPSAREGLPVALLEAMASGLPAVASRLPGATDTIIEDGVNGLLVPPGDAAALDPLAQRLATRARATICDRFTADGVAQGWLNAYATVLETRA
jgi:glycosyltransferase involved in cell wall biosynthesis